MNSKELQDLHFISPCKMNNTGNQTWVSVLTAVRDAEKGEFLYHFITQQRKKVMPTTEDMAM